jgi:hypothetical protein
MSSDANGVGPTVCETDSQIAVSTRLAKSMPGEAFPASRPKAADTDFAGADDHCRGGGGWNRTAP